MNLFNRLKDAEHKLYCICIKVYEMNEKMILLKYVKLYPHKKVNKIEINNFLFESYKDMFENLDFKAK